MKTLQEVKDQVAKKNGFTDWNDLQKQWLHRTGITPVVHESYVDQTAELYAASQLKEYKENIKQP